MFSGSPDSYVDRHSDARTSGRVCVGSVLSCVLELGGPYFTIMSKASGVCRDTGLE